MTPRPWPPGCVRPVPTRRSQSSTRRGTRLPVDAADRVAPLLGEFLDRYEIRSGP